jgi:hypothetical protein
MDILRFNDFYEILLEKSIGSEEIRKKWYPDLDKKIFYKLVNTDPTSVRKKGFSKPGKYVKWLIMQYKRMVYEEQREFKELGYYIYDDLDKHLDYYFNEELNLYLFVFSTGWYKARYKLTDIFKFKSLYDFNDHIRDKVLDRYKIETENAKYDIVFSDDKVDILIPLNFTASRETAKNTDWCSQSYWGFSTWNNFSLLFRIIPKDKTYDKLKLTWEKGQKRWHLACSRYPEIDGDGFPFEVVDGKESWNKILDRKKENANPSSGWAKNPRVIEQTMQLLSDEAKEAITKYYKKFI